MNNAPKQLSLLSYNTYGIPFIAPAISKRYKKFAELAQDKNIDILFLQEVSTYYHLSLLKKYLTDYPYISYKHYFYGPKGGLVIFSRLPLEKNDYTNFSKQGSFTNSSFYTKFIKNGVLTCQLKDSSIILANTHLVTDFEFNLSKKNKVSSLVKRQTHEVGALINRLSKSDKDVVVAGDFNSAKDNDLYTEFLQETKATDLFATLTLPTYHINRISKYLQADKSAIIDYIFLKSTSKKVVPLSVSHLFNDRYPIGKGEKKYLSDHIGLHCVLKVTQ